MNPVSMTQVILGCVLAVAVGCAPSGRAYWSRLGVALRVAPWGWAGSGPRLGSGVFGSLKADKSYLRCDCGCDVSCEEGSETKLRFESYAPRVDTASPSAWWQGGMGCS